MIERQILADQANATKFGSRTCLGIEFENQLVACIIRHRNGSIGILHVDEDHRGLGLGAALLREITQTLLRRKEDMFAFIVDGNKASEALFSKLGWKKANPSGKKGIG
jgi:GNAT superfamily N-acetyltransferase